MKVLRKAGKKTRKVMIGLYTVIQSSINVLVEIMSLAVSGAMGLWNGASQTHTTILLANTLSRRRRKLSDLNEILNKKKKEVKKQVEALLPEHIESIERQVKHVQDSFNAWLDSIKEVSFLSNERLLNAIEKGKVYVFHIEKDDYGSERLTASAGRRQLISYDEIPTPSKITIIVEPEDRV